MIYYISEATLSPLCCHARPAALFRRIVFLMCFHHRYPYWLNGGVPLAVTLQDPALVAEVVRQVRLVLDRAEINDGWLGPLDTLSGWESGHCNDHGAPINGTCGELLSNELATLACIASRRGGQSRGQPWSHMSFHCSACHWLAALFLAHLIAIP